MSAPIAVAGIGSAYRHDDGAGVAFAALLSAHSTEIADVGPLSEPLELLDVIDDVAVLVLADATRAGVEPGHVLVVELRQEAGRFTLPGREHAAERASTHGVGLRRALNVAAVLGKAPPRVVLVGIEGEDFSVGHGLSPAVADALANAVSSVHALLGKSVGV